MKFRHTQLLSKVKTTLRFFYGPLEFCFKPIHVPFKKSKVNEVNWKMMNNIMKHLYFRKELVIPTFDDFTFFDFESETDHLKLSGMTYEPNKGSKKWVIVNHWFAGHKWWGLYNALPFVKMGYNIMAFDYRGHGQSQWDTPTLGVKESRDLLGALKWLKANREYDDLAIMGSSMGAFTTSYTCVKYADEMKKYNVKFGFADCPFGSVVDCFIRMRNIYLKFIPKNWTKWAVNKIIKRINKYEKRNNINMYDGNVFQLMKDGNKPAYPMLFNHSKNDLFTPFTDTYQTVIDRQPLIDGDKLNVYNYVMHCQSLRVHFKNHVKNITGFISVQDNNKQQYNELVKEWKLDEISNWKDRKDERLK